jgi:hypothetical protein
MAVFFSDHYSGADSAGVEAGNNKSAADAQIRPGAGISHGRVRYKRAQIEGMPLTTDTVRFCTFKSSDRILEAYLITDGGCTAGTVDVGIALSGHNHDGALVDVNVFADALVVSTLTARIDMMADGGADNIAAAGENYQRGLTMWELAAMGAGTDTVDPRVNYDILLTPTVSLSVADAILTVEFVYTAGD